MNRRNFLKVGLGIGGGLAVGIMLHRNEPHQRRSVELGPWIQITPDNRVQVFLSKSEMGQGVHTSLPMLIAEELAVSLDSIEVKVTTEAHRHEFKDPAFQEVRTGSSRSVSSSFDLLRIAGATARSMLIRAAAARFGQQRPERLSVEDGRIRDMDTDRSVSFGDVAEEAARLSPVSVPPKPPSEWRLIGSRPPRLDTQKKVTGSAVFGIDVKFPGLLHAALVWSPVIGGRIRIVSDAAARAQPGVQGVYFLDTPKRPAAAVVADTFWRAKQAVQLLEIERIPPDGPVYTDASLETYLRGGFTEKKLIAENVGEAEKALSDVHTHEAEYWLPYLAHASMEPVCCTAHVTATRCELWIPTQAQSSHQALAAELTNLPVESVQVHTTLLGGGFGRKGGSDFVEHAIRLSKISGAPVKVTWTREQDIQQGSYRPICLHRVRAKLDGSGQINAWHHQVVGPSLAFRFGTLKEGEVDDLAVEGAVHSPYRVPNRRVEYVMKNLRVPITVWRSVGHSIHAFVVESFIDELAALSRQDPFAFRRRMLSGQPRHLRVLDALAEKGAWERRKNEGRHLGIALHECYGSIVGQIAEVTKQGDRYCVSDVVSVIDCGTVVHPGIVEAQVQGGVHFGLSAALYGEISFADGQAQQSNFHDYPMVRLDGAPRVQVHIVPSEESPGGVGEPPTPPIAPAVGNALFSATGIRIRRLPFRRSLTV